MKILITGAAGTIGSVLMRCLAGKHELIGIDKIGAKNIIKLDVVGEKDKIASLFNNNKFDAIIHLAWDTKEAGASSDPPVPENKQMGEIVLELAQKHKIKKFILASSVHVSLGHVGYQYPGIVKDHIILHQKKVSVDDDPSPTGTYAKSKIYLENLARNYSKDGMQVLVARFGNVTPDNNFGEYPFWLSHSDLCQFIEKCLATRNLPAFSTFFAISDNPCNPFDLSLVIKLLGYKSHDSSLCPLQER